MASTSGFPGMGVLLKLSDGGSPATYATVANVARMSAGGATLSTEDATQLASPDNYAEFIPTVKAAEEWTFTLHWNPNEPTLDGTTGLRKQFEDRALTTLRLDTTGIGLSTGLEGDGYVTRLGNIDISPTGIMMQECSFKPTGKIREVSLP